MKYALLVSLHAISFTMHGQDNERYCGKTVAQLQQMDVHLNKVINQSWWDNHLVYYYKLVKSPSKKVLCTIKANIEILKQTIQEIDVCLNHAEQELAQLEGRKISIPGSNDSSKIAAAIALSPWFLIEGIYKSRQIKKKKEKINTMLKTKQELQQIIDELQEIAPTN